MGKTLQYNFIIVELLLLLNGHSRSHVTCKALRPFQTKTHSNCSKIYKIEHKVTITWSDDIAKSGCCRLLDIYLTYHVTTQHM